MKPESFVTLLVAVGVILISSIAYRVWRPTTWEYSIIAPSDYEFNSTLAAMGKEGWELTSARRAINDKSGVYEIILKRPAGVWYPVSDKQTLNITDTPSSSTPHSYTPPVRPDQGGPAIAYPAPDDPRAKRVLRACVNGKTVALEGDKWVPYSIGGSAINCVVEP